MLSKALGPGTGLAYELGQCQAIIEAISGFPLLPEYRRRLLELSLSAGAQATTAIEGHTLSLDEVRRIYQGEESRSEQRVSGAGNQEWPERLQHGPAGDGVR